MLFRNDKLIDLIWSPTREDEFVALGNDLYLFQTKNVKNITTSKKIPSFIFF